MREEGLGKYRNLKDEELKKMCIPQCFRMMKRRKMRWPATEICTKLRFHNVWEHSFVRRECGRGIGTMMIRFGLFAWEV